ncbi:hypothetical protein DL96DRAFT_1278142 [Flagelloscypha sp. PMI_526]|nr:hypothetical protein DL96DRAFT_1278142 [Flagelloscypha sp. PMI_526]
MASHAALPSMHSTIGAMEIGIIVNVLLLGATSTQAYYYFVRFGDDNKFLRLFVFAVWLCEIGHTVGVLHALYEVTVTFFGNPITLVQPPKSLILSLVTGGLSTALVQFFFAWRVYQIVGLVSLALFCSFLTLILLAGCLGVSITAYHVSSLPLYLNTHEWLFTSLLVIRMANDIIMTAGLCMALAKSRKSARRRTTAIIDRLLLWTLESGVLTAMCAVVVVICFFQSRSTFIWIGVYVVSPKLFSNSFLAILNGRESLRQQMGSVVTSTLRTDDLMNSGARNRAAPGVMDINVVKVQHTTMDYELGSIPNEKV